MPLHSLHILVSKCHYPLKRTWVLVDSGLGLRKREPGTPLSYQKLSIQENDGNMSKKHQNQPKETPTGQLGQYCLTGQ